MKTPAKFRITHVHHWYINVLVSALLPLHFEPGYDARSPIEVTHDLTETMTCTIQGRADKENQYKI